MSITQTKTQLAEAIGLYEHLKLELNQTQNLDSYTEEEWQARLRNLGLETATLMHTGRILDDPQLIRVLKSKQKKLHRHSLWKKRHRKRVSLFQKQLAKRNEKWIKQTEWQVTMAPTSKPAITVAKKDKLKSKIKEYSRILSKLTLLRSLRRRKLETKGHFFADDGNQFFNKVKAWHEANAVKEEYETVERKPIKKLHVDKADTWNRMRIDKPAYAYWCASDQSLDALLSNRRLWDQYIRDVDDHVDHKVPPTFVTPTPPANGIWASYLLPFKE
ncbi:hypothetical protein INT47_003305 [Mucor saturninus]|uniref:Uncharacterized protein n=1 Tax=Mucor saturninus TaxID=64648 RepID=A0A8H7V7Q3_9FUNG|nr:hypothetical protein INT47_003305 [Mucor saturninus]